MTDPRVKRVLNVGSGSAEVCPIHPFFQQPGWQEVRLDINPGAAPDIVASITDLSGLSANSYDAIWSSHNIEHLYDHEVPIALAELARVLRKDGFCIIRCPDIVAIAHQIVAGHLEAPIYESRSGIVRPLDMLFGFAPSIRAGNAFMQHKTGFSAERLERCLLDAGFSSVRVGNDNCMDLWVIASHVPVSVDLEAVTASVT